MTSIKDIPQFPRAHYCIDVDPKGIEVMLDRWEKMNLDLNPDFQRGHVWTDDQAVAWLEYFFRGGESGIHIYFNHPGWMSSYEGDFVLVDGKQRLTALRRFMKNELPIFGTYHDDFEEARTGRYGLSHTLKFNVACLKTRVEVLKWYINFNVGGTPHSEEEITRVRDLLTKESKTPS